MCAIMQQLYRESLGAEYRSYEIASERPLLGENDPSQKPNDRVS